MLKFRIVSRKVLAGEHKGETHYFAAPTDMGRISYRDFVEEVAEGSTVDPADVKAVIDRMTRVIYKRAMEGCIVDAGELGIFRPTFGSKGVPEKEKADYRLIKRPRIRYTFRQTLGSLRNARFEQVDEATKCKPKPQGGGSTGEGGSTGGTPNTPSGANGNE